VFRGSSHPSFCGNAIWQLTISAQKRGDRNAAFRRQWCSFPRCCRLKPAFLMRQCQHELPYIFRQVGFAEVSDRLKVEGCEEKERAGFCPARPFANDPGISLV
jgi:hypothetical protein